MPATGHKLRTDGHSFQPMAESFYRTWLFARREVVANWLNLKIIIAFVTMLLLFPLSAHLLTVDYKHRLENWAVNQEAQNDPAVSGVVPFKMADGSFLHAAGTKADPPLPEPTALSVLVRGMDKETDRSVTVGQRIGFGPRQYSSNLLALTEAPDAAFVIKLLVSLFALFFSLDSVTFEKKEGTLRALLTHPLKRSEMLFGKMLGAGLSLALPFGLAYFSAVAYLCWARGIISGEEELLRSVLIFIVGLLYAFVFICIGLFISTVTARSKAAAVTALLLWGAVVLILPNATVLAAKSIFPVQSYNHLGARLYEARRQLIQANLGANHPGGSFFNNPNARQVLFQTYEIDRQLTDEFMLGKLSQIEEAKKLARLWPAGALTFGLSDLANTGTSDYRSYVDFLRSGRDNVIDALKRQWDMKPEEGKNLIQETLDSVSVRKRPVTPLEESLRAAAPSIASLFAWAAIFGYAAYRRIQRYDVR